MSDTEFDLPRPFNADSALQQLQRDLRTLKLTARGNGFELRGKRVAELQVEDGADGAISASVARKLALTPEWDRARIGSVIEQRKWIDDLKKRLERWEREE